MINGRIHSIETMGLLDGPGIRTVFFLQGCPLKCKYCHNPDALTFDGGKIYSVEDIVKFSKRYKPYYKETGGVTFSGGEVLMQGEFVLEAIKALKKEGIHVAIDTSGVGQSSYYKDILKLVDLVILDVKSFESSGYQDITGISIKRTQSFTEALNAYKGQVWLRHVMVPGYTDSFGAMDQFADYILKTYKAVVKVEILPYHKLGISKYEQLGLKDPLEGVEEMDQSLAKEYEDYLIGKLVDYRIAV